MKIPLLFLAVAVSVAGGLALPALGQTTAPTTQSLLAAYQQALDNALVKSGDARLTALSLLLIEGVAQNDDQRAMVRSLMGETYMALDREDDAFNAFQSAIESFPLQSDATRAAVSKMGHAAAFKLNSLPRMRQVAVTYLKAMKAVDLDTCQLLLRYVLPANDASQLFIHDDPRMLVELVVRDMRRTTGRIDRGKLLALNTLIINGQGDKLFVVTNEAKALAAELGDSPTNLFLKALFFGSYKQAAGIAYSIGKADPGSYSLAMRSIGRVIRTADQNYNGRVQPFFKWINGDIAENPVPDLVVP